MIAARRLPCKIDKVEGIIETDPTDYRNNSYKRTLKRGDHLLNQIQKLSRAIDVWKFEIILNLLWLNNLYNLNR